MKAASYTLTIRRRSWRFWLLGLVWLAVECLLLQTIWASLTEDEPRAAAISSFIFLALLLIEFAAFVRTAKADQNKASIENAAQADPQSSL